MSDPQTCILCHKFYENRQKLLLHLRRVHPPPDKSRLCKICKKTFKTKASMSDHHDKVHAAGETRCYICNKNYKSHYRLRVHVKVVHLQHYAYLPKQQCELCGREFKNIKLLQQHLRRVHTLKPKQCSLCSKELKSSIYLKRHMLNVHNDQISISLCDYCGKGYRDKYCYINHLKRIHPKEFAHEKDKLIKSSQLSNETERCELCNKMFQNKVALYYHCKTKHSYTNPSFDEELKKKLYKPKRIIKEANKAENTMCCTCNKNFKHKYYLNKHIKLFHSKQQKVKCNMCEKSFKNKSSLQNHSTRIHFRETNKVWLSESDFSNDDNKPLIDHEAFIEVIPNSGDYNYFEQSQPDILKPHGSNSVLILKKQENKDTIDKKDNNETSEHLKKHLKSQTHHLEETQDCKQCSKTPPIHKKEGAKEDLPEKWVCEICCKMFNSKLNLNRHVKYAHPSDAERTSCEICHKVFKANLHLIHHMKSVHSLGSTSYICEICSKEYKNKIRLQRHIKRTHMSKHQFKQCNLCSQKFTANSSLKLHILNIHACENVSRKCGICEKVLSNEKCLRAHIKSMHITVEKQTCEKCNKTYKNKDSLRTHMKSVHTSDTDSYACEICAKKFQSKIYLQQHLRRNHSTV